MADGEAGEKTGRAVVAAGLHRTGIYKRPRAIYISFPHCCRIANCFSLVKFHNCEIIYMLSIHTLQREYTE